MVQQTEASGTSGAWADAYRDRWKWDKVTWGSHAVDCYPGGCPFRVYTRDGKIVREEQAGVLPLIDKSTPDMNPMGCQKGASWCTLHYSQDRVTTPLKRAGERGEGKWEEVSWDEALADICDAMLDAVEDQGAESIIVPFTPELGAAPARAAAGAIGAFTTDGNAEFQDFSPGYHITWGKFNPISSMDDWFLAELTLIWHANPVYTNIQWYHYLAESRYNGGEIVTIAPDYSASAIHADYHLPVRIGTDAALALSMCKVMIDAGIYNKQFVKEQTDLSLLVRKDTGRFLRGDDLAEGWRDDQFFWLDSKSDQIVPAPRGTLAMGDVDPTLEGSQMALLSDGSEVEVEPAFEFLKRRLEDYTPEKAAKICEIHPATIRKLAHKIATRKTKIFIGWNSGKYYHGDLMERSMALLLGLSGNWGKKGTGTRSWGISGSAGGGAAAKERPGPQAAWESRRQLLSMFRLLSADDPTMTHEIAVNRAASSPAGGRLGGLGRMGPPAFLWYKQFGYKERWDNKDWQDPTMKREFSEYMEEALEKGWWDSGAGNIWEDTEPRVLIEAGGNILRRQRGGQEMLLKHLWPKLKMIVSIDYRITTTGIYSDYILPAAQHYEKFGTSMPSIHHMNTVLIEPATPPLGNSKSDRQIGLAMLKKLEERAKARGMTEITGRDGQTVSLEGLWDRATLDGELEDDEAAFDDNIQDNAVFGVLPKGTTLETLRQKGAVRWTAWGVMGHGLAQASTIKPDEVQNPFRWHTEEKVPYPTLTRRAQYYIDHEWFLEAGEELPVHKETPPQGGNGEFILTSGHNRWSIHSMNMTNNIILNTHRGEPFMFMNNKDAAAKGLENGVEVRVFNEAGSMLISVKISPSVRPGQVIIYNGFEPYMHRGWNSQADIEPGIVKWLGMAGGYGHLQYRPLAWQPIPADRAVNVDVEKAT